MSDPATGGGTLNRRMVSAAVIGMVAGVCGVVVTRALFGAGAVVGRGSVIGHGANIAPNAAVGEDAGVRQRERPE